MVQKRVFVRKNSVFHPWIEDNQEIFDDMFENDILCWKMHGYVKNEDDQ